MVGRWPWYRKATRHRGNGRHRGCKPCHTFRGVEKRASDNARAGRTPSRPQRLAASSAALGGRGIPRSRTTIRPSIARREPAWRRGRPERQVYTDSGRGWAVPIGVRPRSNGLGEHTLRYHTTRVATARPTSERLLTEWAPMPRSATPAVPEVADRVGGSSRTRTWDPLTKRPTKEW